VLGIIDGRFDGLNVGWSFTSFVAGDEDGNCGENKVGWIDGVVVTRSLIVGKSVGNVLGLSQPPHARRHFFSVTLSEQKLS